MNKKVHRLLHQLHIYSGLFCASYLIVAAFSALNIQHHVLPALPTDTITYTQKLTFNGDLKADSLAKYITHSLGIKGNAPPWDYRQDASGGFRFKIYRPGKQYDVEMNRKSELIKINEIHFSSGRIIDVMHKSIFAVLDDFPLKVWGVYGQLSALCAIFTIFTSIYFWYKRSIGSVNKVIIASSALISVFYILYIWLIG